MSGSSALAISRLRRELGAFHAEQCSRADGSERPKFYVNCDEWNMLNFAYVLAGKAGTPYEGGWFWGRLKFPENYPLAPPSIEMCTPSGRFQTNVRLCLSISDFHPENWKPAWGFATVLEGLHTFMAEDTHTHGIVEPKPSQEERRRLASASAAWNLEQVEFRSHFPDFEESLSSYAGDASKDQTGNCAQTVVANDTPVSEVEEPIPPELMCGLCSRLLLEPVSIACGHTFCKGCLERAAASSFDGSTTVRCPTCSKPLAGGGGRVNVVIKGVVAQRCPRALASRRLAESAESAEGQTTRPPQVATESVVLPLLCSSVVLFPGSHSEIELRTVQQRQAVEHAIREGGRRIGLIDQELTSAEDSAWDGIVGCCVEVENFAQAGLRRPYALAQLVAKYRFRLSSAPLSRQSDDGQLAFWLGRLETMRDDPLDDSELVDAVTISGGTGASSRTSALSLARGSIVSLQSHLVCLGQAGRNAFRAEFGRGPVASLERNDVTSTLLEDASFWLASAVAVNSERRKLWLLSTDTRARLEDVSRVLSGSTGQVALNLAGANSWMNAGKSVSGNALLLLAIGLILILKAMGYV